MGALGLSGGAALVSVALPAAQRGELVATMAGGTLGSAIGSFSIDTFLLSRPTGWVLSRGGRWIAAMAVTCLALSAAVATAVIAIANVGSYPLAAGAACALTAVNVCSSLALRIKKFVFVYVVRAAGAAVVVAGYLWLYANGQRSGNTWSSAWLLGQALAAAVLCLVVARWAVAWRQAATAAQSQMAAGAEYRDDVSAMARLHAGVSAQMLTFRLDQVLLARFAGAGPLGVYALAVAALEFAQAGAVVKAQRILAGRGEAGPTGAFQAAKAAVPVAVLAVIGLAALGVIRPEYADAWLLGLLLLPGCLAVYLGKIWSAELLKQRGEQVTTNVALLTLAVAIPSYLAAISWAAAVGAAVASSLAYAVHAGASRASLRRAPSRAREVV